MWNPSHVDAVVVGKDFAALVKESAVGEGSSCQASGGASNQGAGRS